MGATYHLGTSGFAYDDWPFYPRGLARGGRLKFYALHFDALEVNVTYYRLVPPSVAEGMLAAAPDLHYVVKAHRGVTHDRVDAKQAARAFESSVEPFVRAGRYAGTLLQFPFSFRPDAHSVEYVAEAGKFLRPLGRVFAEFRNAAWYTESTWDALSRADVSAVTVDLPDLPGLPPRIPVATTGVGYYRLHGRNAAGWWGGHERYDYRYADAELVSIAETARALAKKCETVYVFFNNCHRGSAADNARQLARLLGLALGEADPQALARVYPPAAQGGLFGG